MQTERILDLPLVREDEDNICLPLVISVVARYWHQDIPLEEAKSIARKYPNVKASIMIEGIELAEKHNFKTFIYKGDIKDLKKRIEQGFAPIVIMPGIKDVVQHALVIQGYDESKRKILTYIPEPDKMGAIEEQKFKELWEEDDNLTLLLVPDDMSMYVKDNLKFLRSNRVCFEAERARLLGKHEEALELLSNSKEDNPRVWYMLGVIYSDLKDYKRAEECYKQALAFNKRFYLAYRGLGNLYLKIKDYKRAEEYYTRAIEINPNRFAPIYKNRAIARLELGKNKDAVEDLRLYLKYYPDASDKASIEAYIKELS
ncbi:MAG: hypothetical protein KatS3mg003_1654 [Candidatus Nitrosocaldaceae archaeon]|nr:MAG: hypothetical protein KatS3mg003_1654 [Candidatus Nitrosocaldaceae archaeon]